MVNVPPALEATSLCEIVISAGEGVLGWDRTAVTLNLKPAREPANLIAPGFGSESDGPPSGMIKVGPPLGMTLRVRAVGTVRVSSCSRAAARKAGCRLDLRGVKRASRVKALMVKSPCSGRGARRR